MNSEEVEAMVSKKIQEVMEKIVAEKIAQDARYSQLLQRNQVLEKALKEEIDAKEEAEDQFGLFKMAAKERKAQPRSESVISVKDLVKVAYESIPILKGEENFVDFVESVRSYCSSFGKQAGIREFLDSIGMKSGEPRLTLPQSVKMNFGTRTPSQKGNGMDKSSVGTPAVQVSRQQEDLCEESLLELAYSQLTYGKLKGTPKIVSIVKSVNQMSENVYSKFATLWAKLTWAFAPNTSQSRQLQSERLTFTYQEDDESYENFLDRLDVQRGVLQGMYSQHGLSSMVTSDEAMITLARENMNSEYKLLFTAALEAMDMAVNCDELSYQGFVSHMTAMEKKLSLAKQKAALRANPKATIQMARTTTPTKWAGTSDMIYTRMTAEDAKRQRCFKFTGQPASCPYGESCRFGHYPAATIVEMMNAEQKWNGQRWPKITGTEGGKGKEKEGGKGGKGSKGGKGKGKGNGGKGGKGKEKEGGKGKQDVEEDEQHEEGKKKKVVQWFATAKEEDDELYDDHEEYDEYPEPIKAVSNHARAAATPHNIPAEYMMNMYDCDDGERGKQGRNKTPATGRARANMSVATVIQKKTASPSQPSEEKKVVYTKKIVTKELSHSSNSDDSDRTEFSESEDISDDDDEKHMSDEDSKNSDIEFDYEDVEELHREYALRKQKEEEKKLRKERKMGENVFQQEREQRLKFDEENKQRKERKKEDKKIRKILEIEREKERQKSRDSKKARRTESRRLFNNYDERVGQNRVVLGILDCMSIIMMYMQVVVTSVFGIVASALRTYVRYFAPAYIASGNRRPVHTHTVIDGNNVSFCYMNIAGVKPEKERRVNELLRKGKEGCIYMDGGANWSSTGVLELFKKRSMKKCNVSIEGFVDDKDGNTVTAQLVGDIEFQARVGGKAVTVEIKNVLYVPVMGNKTLLSQGCLMNRGCNHTSFSEAGIIRQYDEKGKPWFDVVLGNDTLLHCEESATHAGIHFPEHKTINRKAKCNNAICSNFGFTKDQLHKKLGHINEKYLDEVGVDFEQGDILHP